jgi:hypothetical protein
MPADTRQWEAVKARVAAAGQLRVRVGIVGDAAAAPHGDTGETNAEIGLWMEFGTSRIPERSFIRATLRDPKFRATLKVLQERGIRGILEGRMTAQQALGLIGEFAATAMKRRILDGEVTPPLAPSTVAYKEAHGGTATPLIGIDPGGELVRSISWVIV